MLLSLRLERGSRLCSVEENWQLLYAIKLESGRKITFYHDGFMLNYPDKAQIRWHCSLRLTLGSAQIIPSLDREQICSSVMAASESTTKRESFTFLSFFIGLSDILIEISAFRNTRQTLSRTNINQRQTIELINQLIRLFIHSFIRFVVPGRVTLARQQAIILTSFPKHCTQIGRYRPSRSSWVCPEWGQYMGGYTYMHTFDWCTIEWFSFITWFNTIELERDFSEPWPFWTPLK